MSFLSFVRIPLAVFRHLCRSQSNIFLIYVLETTGNCVEFTSLRIVVKNKLLHRTTKFIKFIAGAFTTTKVLINLR